MLRSMCILDRYLLRQFVQTFLICFISITGLFIVLDVSTNLDQFVTCGKKAGGVLSFIVDYYSCSWMAIFEYTSSMLALVSAMFTVAWIQRHNEMTALMAAGVSRVRVLAPIIVAVGVVSLLASANREFLIPRYRHEISRRPQDPLGDQPQDVKACYDNETDVVLRGKSTYAGQRRIEKPNFSLTHAPGLRIYGDQLVAENAYYKSPQGDRPGGYLLTGVHEPRHLDSQKSLPLKGEAVLITPHDRPDWLQPDECFVRSGVEFDLLTPNGDKAFRDLSSTGQLIAALRNPSLGYGAKVRVAIHARMVKPLMDMTLLFLSLPLVVTRESRNVFIAIGMCMAVTVAFTLVMMGLQHLGEESLLTPTLAAWAPLMLFAPPAVGLSELLWK
jgi:lipopolysaccharide export system permease protein